jgi:Protein of unknown function (DUF3309)
MRIAAAQDSSKLDNNELPIGVDPMRRNPLAIVLVVLLVILLIGLLPSWPYSVGWGYYPSGGLGLLLLILVVLLLADRL